MADSQISVSVPTELNAVGGIVQNIVNGVVAKQSLAQIVSGALPLVFAEGGKFDEIRAELKDPQVYMLAGVLVGGIVSALMVAKAAKAAAAASSAVADAQAAASQASPSVVP